MTTILGLNTGEFCILASDTRVTFLNNDDYEDCDAKIFQTGCGLMAGTGYEFLVLDVAAALEDPRVTDVWKMQTALVGARDALIQRFGTGSPAVNQHIASTRFFCSAVVQGKTQVLIYEPTHTERKFAGFCSPGNVLVTAPGGAADGLDRQWQIQLTKKIRPGASFSSPKKSIEYHSCILKNFIRELSREYPNVSANGALGIHRRNGQIEMEQFGSEDISAGEPWDSLPVGRA